MSGAGQSPTGSHAAEWWRGCAIYQIYPRSFQDTTGDGIGDLSGIAERMPYVASLGVDAIWLSPFFKSPMADMGYDVSDYTAVDPLFGSMQDFERVVAEAHRHSIRVIIDQVLSHTSDRHPWFVESRSSRDNAKANWYVWAPPKPDGSPPTNWLSVFGGSSWEWDSTRRQYYLHNFLAAQPDLNLHNPEVQDALLDAVRFWLDKGVDGFRLDTVNYYFHDRWLRDNPPLPESVAGTNTETNPYLYQLHLFDKTQPENLAFLERFRVLLDSYDARMSVGEVGDEWRSLQTVAAYTEAGKRLDMCYTFDLLGPKFSAEHVRACVEAFERSVSGGWICWAYSNHDVNRHVTRWTLPGEDPDSVAAFAIALLVCLRGSICLYQGEELGLGEAEIAFADLRDPYGIRFWPGYKGRDGCRTPMVWRKDAQAAGFTVGQPWLPVPDAHGVRAVDMQEGDPGSTLSAYRAALAFRRAHPALVTGDIEFLDAVGNVLAFRRKGTGKPLLCLFNFDREPARWSGADIEALDEVLVLPGINGTVEGGVVALSPRGVFVARLK